MSGTFVTLGTWLFAGMLIGAIHAGLLYRSVTALAGAAGAPVLIALNAGRLIFVVAAFWLVARQGAGAAPLISAAVGFTVAEIAARQIVRRA